VKPAGMAELLYNELECRLDFVRNYRRIERNSEPDFKNHFKSRAEERTAPFSDMLAIMKLVADSLLLFPFFVSSFFMYCALDIGCYTFWYN
jgi:hypothetical protein